MSEAWIIFVREWREALRDRRTIVVMLVVPLLFYPLAMGAMGYFGARQQAELELRELKVGVVSPEFSALEELGKGIKVSPAETGESEALLTSGEFDVVVEVPAGAERMATRELKLHYRNTVEGASAKDRVRLALLEYEKDLVEGRFLSMGQPASASDPFAIEEVDHAPLREAAGSRFGGLLGYLLVFLGFTGCLATAVDTGAGEKERGTFEAMLVTPVSRISLVVGKWFFVFSAGLLSIMASLTGLVLLALLGWMGSGLPFEISSLVLLFEIIGLTLLTLAFTSAMLLGVSLVSQNTKQAQSMTSPVFLGVSLVLVFALLPGTELSGLALVTPIISAALAIREAIAGTLQWGQFLCILVTHVGLSVLWLSWVKRRLSREGSLLG